MRPHAQQLNRGSISVALAGVLALTLPLLAVAVGIANGVILQQRLESAADNAALAASDIRRGLFAGIPCETAAEIARLASATLETCRIVNDCVLVEVATTHVIWVIRAAALAGPP